MITSNNQYLTDCFSGVIEQAWKGVNSSAVGTPEPNHVARSIQGAPAGMATAIKSVPGVQSVAVQGTFCHQNPYAFWKQDGAYPCCELADLLVVVELVHQLAPKRRRALLFQTKMGGKDKSTWALGQKICGLTRTQRGLHTDLPLFCLEMDSRPTRDMVEPTGLDLSTYMLQRSAPAPFDLTSLPLQHPVGLVYAAIDVKTDRVGAGLTPWLAENGRPPKPTTYSAVFDVTFPQALAEMVTEVHPRFGVDCDPAPATTLGWPRLIDDLGRWASMRNVSGHGSGHGVTFKAGTLPTNEYFHNIQTFQVECGRLQSLMQWQHVAGPEFSRRTWPIALAPRLVRRRRSEFSEAVLRAVHGGDTRLPWPKEIDFVEPGGFGVLKNRIEIDPRVELTS